MNSHRERIAWHTNELVKKRKGQTDPFLEEMRRREIPKFTLGKVLTVEGAESSEGMVEGDRTIPWRTL